MFLEHNSTKTSNLNGNFNNANLNLGTGQILGNSIRQWFVVHKSLYCRGPMAESKTDRHDGKQDSWRYTPASQYQRLIESSLKLRIIF